MIKIVCDRCEKEISGKPRYIAFGTKGLESAKIFGDGDYCEECIKEIKAFITHGHAQTPTEPISTNVMTVTPAESTPPAAGQTTDNKAGKRNSQIDMGKVNALRDAGWSIGKIAEDMQVDPTEIAEKIYDRKKAGM